MQNGDTRERRISPTTLLLIILGLILGASALARVYFDGVDDKGKRAHVAALAKLSELAAQEEVGVLSAIGGDTNALSSVVVAHQNFLALANGMQEGSVFADAIKEESTLALELLTEGERTGIFDKLAKAKIDFIDKNNKHVARLSGYRSSWLTLGSPRDVEASVVLDAIRAERNLVDAFVPSSVDREKIINDFRGKNDFVVSELIRFWADDVDKVLPKIKNTASKELFTTCRAIFPNVTSTSFPQLSEKDATLLAISATSGPLAGKNAETATVKLYERLDREVEALEKGGTALWPRHTVANVGENVTPNKTLGEIIKCQQGLRINAEDIFALRIRLNDDVRPRYTKLVADLKKEQVNAEIGIGDHGSTAYVLGGVSLLLLIVAFVVQARRRPEDNQGGSAGGGGLQQILSEKPTDASTPSAGGTA